jgi:hypothetical protein
VELYQAEFNPYFKLLLGNLHLSFPNSFSSYFSFSFFSYLLLMVLHYLVCFDDLSLTAIRILYNINDCAHHLASHLTGREYFSSLH